MSESASFRLQRQLVPYTRQVPPSCRCVKDRAKFMHTPKKMLQVANHMCQFRSGAHSSCDPGLSAAESLTRDGNGTRARATESQLCIISHPETVSQNISSSDRDSRDNVRRKNSFVSIGYGGIGYGGLTIGPRTFQNGTVTTIESAQYVQWSPNCPKHR